MLWYSDANAAARFKEYDENSCDPDWYEQDDDYSDWYKHSTWYKFIHFVYILVIISKNNILCKYNCALIISDWVLPQYQQYGDSHCDYFTTDSSQAVTSKWYVCQYVVFFPPLSFNNIFWYSSQSNRLDTFCEQDNCWFYSESLIGTNGWLYSSACSMY